MWSVELNSLSCPLPGPPSVNLNCKIPPPKKKKKLKKNQPPNQNISNICNTVHLSNQNTSFRKGLSGLCVLTEMSLVKSV